MDILDFSNAGSEADFLRMKAMELAEAETASEKGHVLEDVALRKNGFYTRFCKKMKIPPSSADRLRKLYKGSLVRWQ